jgi:hypothetical protein
MKTIDEIACEYCNKSFQCSKPKTDKEYCKTCGSGRKKCFLDGVEFAQRWIPTAEELPDKDGTYLCKDTYDKQIKLLVYNKNHGCWDDHSGDDYYCDIDRISHWRKIELK